MMTLSSDFETDKQRLFDLLVETEAFQYSPDKKFELASGATSEYYFDLKLLNGHPEGINAVAKVFYHYIKQIPEVRAVGGLEAGSISIATAISQLSYFEHENDPSNPLITSFFVRKEPKKYGTEKLIEGKITSPVVIIDDVITSGLSAITAVNAVKEKGYECKCLMSIIFRGTEKHREDIEKNIKLQFIFHKDQFIEQFKRLAA
jgi:orotate phosphoribosyltransferase